jgi:hypothetical protein
MVRNSVCVQPHFHIRWIGEECWDWEDFDSIPDAMARAADLADPGEMFKIEEASEA